MKTKQNSKAIELLSQNEIVHVKGGQERHYYTVIIDGKEVRIYV